MKTTMVLLILLACALAACAQAADGLKNGGFEVGEKDAPADWKLTAAPGATAAWEPTGGVDNSGCVSITVTEPASGEGVLWEQEVQLRPYTAYLLKGCIKGENVKLADPFGKETGPSIASGMWLCDTIRLKSGPKATGAFDWTPFVIDFATSPDGKAAVYCRFGRGMTVGKAWFDNLSVEPNPDTERFESKHFVLNLYKDEVEVATRKGVKQQLKNVDKLYDAYKDLTGNDPGKEKGSAYAPRLWGIEAMGWSGNPLLWIADQNWMKTYWRKPDYCAEIFLHEMAHNFDAREWVFDGHFSEIMFYYACERLNFVIGEDKGPHKGKDVRERWHLRGADAGVPDPAYIIYKLIPFIDQVGWEPMKKTYRSFRSKPVEGLPEATPEELKTRWGKFKAFLDRLSFFSGRDAWSIFTPEEVALVKRCYTYQRTEPTARPDEIPDDTKSAWLSDYKWDKITVGYGRPGRNWAEGGFPLRSYERVHDKGLATHAPALTEFTLGGKWKSLDMYCGLIRRSKGSVIFVVNGDGKELYRSDKVTDQKERHVTLDVSGVNKLELIVEDAGDGRTWDWGLWLSPKLER